ncbi:MAG: carbohydrate porin [Endozoicomonas sp.]|uniref:carbohydrate porin n=1 Tax=Endozoicomonas sp. TaxID=1892382 RepID=UPI003D9ADBC8
MTEFQNGVWAELGIRAEYGNGESAFYSSPGSENTQDDGQFEVKEAFMKIGGLSYLPEDAHVWAGRRYLNRQTGLLSGEFWRQSSGVGFGYEQGRSGIAVVSVDPGEKDNKDNIEEKVGDCVTMHSIDLYSYGHEALGGSFDYDLKIMLQDNKGKFEKAYGDNAATNGIGTAITYNRDYYGLDGWSTTALAYGTGMAANRGVDFGAWSGLVRRVAVLRTTKMPEPCSSPLTVF